MSIYATVFDTETSGFVENGLCQLAAIQVDHDMNIVNKFVTLVIPEGFDSIEEKAQEITGHTIERCTSDGMPMKLALTMLKRMVEMGDIVVCHNKGYDIDRVVKKCCSILEVENFLDRTTNFCTMLAMTDVCKIPGRYGKYKWPNLQEAHTHCFGKGFDGAHEAEADVLATIKVLRWIKDNQPHLLPRV